MLLSVRYSGNLVFFGLTSLTCKTQCSSAAVLPSLCASPFTFRRPNRTVCRPISTIFSLNAAMAADRCNRESVADGQHTWPTILIHHKRAFSDLDTFPGSKPGNIPRIRHPKALGRRSRVQLSLRHRTIRDYHCTGCHMLRPLRGLPIPPSFFPNSANHINFKQPSLENVQDCLLVVATVFHIVAVLL